MRGLLILLLLAGCAAHRPQPPAALLEPCAERTVPPPAPRPPRTAPVLAAWSIQLQLAREATDRALAECSSRHAELAAWARGLQ